MTIEALRQRQSPYPFHSRKEAGEAIPQLYRETLAFGQEDVRKLQEINELLQNPEVDRLVDEGKLTLGIIKPNAHMGRGLPRDDEEAASKLLEEIGREHIVFDFSTQLTPKQIETFYADVKERYSGVYANPEDEKSIWEGVFEMLNTDPATFLLIYRKEGDAISWWRQKMGKTHPAEADPQSIRGKYGIEENLPNNLTHGSDSIEGAKTEISALRGIVSELTERSVEVSNKFPTEQVLRNLKILDRNQKLNSIQRFYDSGMRSESWIYAYRLTFLDRFGNKQTKLVKEKNIISMGGALEQKAQRHLQSFQKLTEIGINTPHTYGVDGASLYMDFIEDDRTEEALDELQKTPSSRNDKLEQLIEIAARLDKSGYLTQNFIGDVIYDGDSEKFLYIDAGYDLGEATDESTNSAHRTLVSTFRRHSDYIDSKYWEIRQSLQQR